MTDPDASRRVESSESDRPDSPVQPLVVVALDATGDAQDESVPASETPSDKAPAVTRSIKVLKLLAQNPQGLSLSEIARSLAMAKSSTFNICAALEDGGMVMRSDGGYALGRETAVIGSAFLRSFDPVREFYRICASGGVLGRELLQIAVLDGAEALFVAKYEGRSPLGQVLRVGDKFPASLTAVGRALLARHDDAEVERLISAPSARPQLTSGSTTTISGLRERLGTARTLGYAVDEGEVVPNALCYAMVVPSVTSEEPALALGVTIVRSTATQDYRDQIIIELRKAVARLGHPSF